MPVLLTTGYNDEMSLDGPKAGSLEVLGKPYKRSEMIDRVQAALRHGARTGAGDVRLRPCPGVGPSKKIARLRGPVAAKPKMQFSRTRAPLPTRVTPWNGQNSTVGEANREHGYRRTRPMSDAHGLIPDTRNGTVQDDAPTTRDVVCATSLGLQLASPWRLPTAPDPAFPSRFWESDPPRPGGATPPSRHRA